MLTLQPLLQQLVERGGSDLYLRAGAPPILRVGGLLKGTADETLNTETTRQLINATLSETQLLCLREHGELDYVVSFEGLGRFRVSVFQQKQALSAVFRAIPATVPGLEEIGLDEELCDTLCAASKGLILVTGAKGSGKSTTIAALLDFINQSRAGHIVTLEAPIEFVHRSKSCLVNQREIGSDTHGFHKALRAVLRQDPDVVLIGEMRDTETIEAALTLSAVGHLTFGSMHSFGYLQSLNRMVDDFPFNQRPSLRQRLGSSLIAAIWQQLVTGRKGPGRVPSRVPCREIVCFDKQKRWLIQNDQAEQIDSILRTGGRAGILTMNESLYQAVQAGLIDTKTALRHSDDRDEFRRRLAGVAGPRGDFRGLGDSSRIRGC